MDWVPWSITVVLFVIGAVITRNQALQGRVYKAQISAMEIHTEQIKELFENQRMLAKELYILKGEHNQAMSQGMHRRKADELYRKLANEESKEE